MTQPTSKPVTVREAGGLTDAEIDARLGVTHLFGDASRTQRGVLRNRVKDLIKLAVAAARVEAIEEAAKIPDLWANSNTCDPPRTCDHQTQGGEIAERIRALARKGVEP